MRPVSEHLLEQIDGYIEHCCPPDAVLAQNLKDSQRRSAGNCSVAGAGRFLYILAKITGAKRFWKSEHWRIQHTVLARAVPESGKVVTSNSVPCTPLWHGRIWSLRSWLTVEIRVGPGAETLDKMIQAGEESFDFVFIDADKPAMRDIWSRCCGFRIPDGNCRDNLIRAGRPRRRTADELVAGVKNSIRSSRRTRARIHSADDLQRKVDGMSFPRE